MNQPVELPAATTNVLAVKSVLRVDRLRKSYRSRTVVSDVSFSVESGEVVGLLGPNGAGKTTCFYMIVGLVPVDGGKIYLDGNDLSHLPIFRRSRLGLSYLPQEASIFRKLTVAENIQAVLELRDLSSEEIDAKREALLDELHIEHLRNSLQLVFPAGSGGGLRSRARWRLNRVLFCWMSRSQGWIQSQ